MTSADFLEIALLRAPTPAEIDELLTSHVNEDRWLEYKRGEWLTDTDKKRQQKLRQYIAAFANADGGAILVGVAGAEKPEKPTDKQWAVDGCPKEQSQPWDEWASNSLSPLSGYLSRQPRIHSVQHAEAKVLVVAVRRSNGLVPCIENCRPVHFMRIGHQTLPLDPSLYADLVLGRRQSPLFDVELLDPTIEPGQPAPWFGLRVNFTVRNVSLVWVPDLQIGIIGDGSFENPPTMQCIDGGAEGARTKGETISRALSDYVEVLPKRHRFPVDSYSIRSRPRPALNTAPFASIVCDALFTLPTTMNAQRQRWRGAIYIAPTNGLPQWFAVRIEYQSMPNLRVRGSEVVPVDDERIPIDWA